MTTKIIPEGSKTWGGARTGAGRKVGSESKVKHHSIRITIEKAIGMSYEQLVAETAVKLFNDFKEDKNVREYLSFLEQMNKRVIEKEPQEINIVNSADTAMDEELRNKAVLKVWQQEKEHERLQA
jgi:hypothetical protein